MPRLRFSLSSERILWAIRTKRTALIPINVPIGKKNQRDCEGRREKDVQPCSSPNRGFIERQAGANNSTIPVRKEIKKGIP